jgi:hypothetical protein
VGAAEAKVRGSLCWLNTQTYWPDFVDRSLRLTSYWANCEAHLAKDVKAARRVWEDVVKSPAGRCKIVGKGRRIWYTFGAGPGAGELGSNSV